MAVKGKDYKGTQFMGGPINQHKALAMGLNPDVGVPTKNPLPKLKTADVSKKPSAKK